mmetsp:Transcript_19327/g.41053  ORF Transcript_19327/g.41053 Transcript_19327/m.41053 type:complete len:1084 (-) Transcript_19327:52-3303(-)
MNRSETSSPVPHQAWMPRVPMEEMLSLLRGDRENLPSVIEHMDEQEGEKRKLSQPPIDLRRVEIINRILELLAEQSPSNIGVIQSTIVTMFVSTYFASAVSFFYTTEEIDEGCMSGPSQPLQSAIEEGVDDRLVVTIETFETMIDSIPNFELARLLDAYTDYVQTMEMAWQVTTLEKRSDPRDEPRIKSAAGIAVCAEHAYVADNVQHGIFRVNMITDDITHLCGMLGRMGFHDGPREMAKFNNPSGVAMCESTSTLYVCDTGNDAIRAVSIPSGVVQTLSLSPSDLETRLETPVGICIVRGDYEYEKEGSEEDNESEDDANTVNSEQDFDEDEDDDALGRGHGGPLLEGISEEDEDMVDPSMSNRQSQRLSFTQAWGDGGGSFRSGSQTSNARYALATADPSPNKLGLAGRIYKQSKSTMSTRRQSSFTDTGHFSRRTSGYMSSQNSRRASSYMSSVSSLSSRRTSTHFSMTPGESAKDSLRECTAEDEETGYNLAVTSDHCIFLVKPEKGDLLVLAGSPTEYGYKDAEKGSEARFSSLKGITCIRNCLFVADHWNNAIRCVNLKTRQVDTVIDFQPCGPIALTVSSSGSVYVLDSEYISVCNILKICSLQCSTKDSEGALGTTMFQMIQESIGKARSQAGSSNRSSLDLSAQLIESMSRRGSARASRRASAESIENLSRRGSINKSRRGSQTDDIHQNALRRLSGASGDSRLSAGSISNLGPRHAATEQAQLQLLPPSLSHMQSGRQRASNQLQLPGGAKPGDPHQRRSASQLSGSQTGTSALPVVPRALRSLVPGASLHPALVQMTLRSRGDSTGSIQTALTGSQFHVSVVSSVEDDFDEGPEFFSFLNPKHETPWKKIPISTLQHIYMEATGQCTSNAPLVLTYWDAADSDATAAVGMRNTQQLLVGGSEFPSVLKVLPPRKAPPQDNGRFRAVAVDVDRVVMADSDSNQIFVVNHTKRTKDKIAGCGKAGYLDGPLDVCRMNQPSSIALDPTTHYIYVADSGNHRIRCIDLSTGFMRTVCGNGVKGNRDGGELRLQSLDSPFDLHFMHPCHLLISCADNSIRRLDLRSSQLDTVLVGS